MHQEEARQLDGEMATVAAGLNDEVRTSEYFLVLEQLERTRAEVRRVVQQPENCLPYIQVKGLWCGRTCVWSSFRLKCWLCWTPTALRYFSFVRLTHFTHCYVGVCLLPTF